MKRIIILSIILTAITVVSAYSQTITISPEFQRFYDDFEYLKKFNESAEVNYDGSPYLNEEFEKGKIILADGIGYKDILLRYNIYNDEFEFSKGNKALALEKDSRFSAFIIGDSEFYYKKYLLKEKAVEGYLLKLVEGNYSLYLKYSIILREGEKPKPFQEARKPTFVAQKPLFMIGLEDNIIPIKKLKDLYKAFPGTENMVSNYSGDMNLKLKSKNDFIKLVTYLNSIGKTE